MTRTSTIRNLLRQIPLDRLAAATRQRLEAAGYAPDRVHHEVVSGADSRAMGLIQFARQNDIGTLVMGRRGLSRVEDFLMGCVGHKIVNTVRNRAVWIVA